MKKNNIALNYNQILIIDIAFFSADKMKSKDMLIGMYRASFVESLRFVKFRCNAHLSSSL